MKLETREVTENDYHFAFDVKKQAIGPHIQSKCGWDEAYQLNVHKQRWNEKPWFIISLDGEEIGTVSIHHLEHATRFGEFYILDQYRNKGIGSLFLQRFLKQCDTDNRTVILEYLKWNPVGSLYKRNHFAITDENDKHYFMARPPQILEP